MVKHRPDKPVKVTCSADGCTRYRSHQEPAPGTCWVWLCRQHWDRVPRDHRKRMAAVKRLQGRAVRKGREDTARVLNIRWGRLWHLGVGMAKELPPSELAEWLDQ